MVSLIAALSENYVIGNEGKIPWHISEDFKVFKETTLNGVIIMGRKTYESIGRPLPKRKNIIVSSSMKTVPEGITNVVSSLESAIEEAKKYKLPVFICGGQSLYKEGLDYADKLYLSHIRGRFQGDTYFPIFDKTVWRPTYEEDYGDFIFRIWEK